MKGITRLALMTALIAMLVLACSCGKPYDEPEPTGQLPVSTFKVVRDVENLPYIHHVIDTRTGCEYLMREDGGIQPLLANSNGLYLCVQPL